MDIEQLYRTFEHDLERFARSLARHEAEAYDLVQDTFSKAMSHMKLLDHLTKPQQRAWLFRVLKNGLIDRRRREKFEVFYDEQQHEPEFDVHEYSTVEITELLSRLPEDMQDIVFKRYWVGMSSQQIGEELSIPAATVRYRLHVCIKLLRQWLADD